MKVVGVYLVRNEVDVIETNLRHHFASAIDEAVVIDNGSTDGTLELLSELAEELPLQLSSEVGPMFQSERVTRMARYAISEGADWVLPIDADEFWVGCGMPFRRVLEEAPAEARALFVEVVNFIQSREVLTSGPECLTTMTMRAAEPVGPVEECSSLVRHQRIGWVEAMYTPKCVHRARPDVFVPRGNHLSGVPGGVHTDDIVCLHAPFRSYSILTTKLDHGRRAVEDGSSAQAGWQSKRWWGMARTRTLDHEWEALSYRDGALTVGGERHELVRDERLRDAVEAVAPSIRFPVPSMPQPVDEMDPAVGAYFLALHTVPGWFSELDFRVLVELDRVQRAHGIEGDLFEIGAYMGRSAILLGHLVREPAERLTVCDVFEHLDLVDAESFPAHNHWHGDLDEKSFMAHYQRFHQQLPDIIVGLSEKIDARDRARTCRLVHVDGGHRHEVVRHDAATARTLLLPGGIVAFDDVATPHNPGAALAVWELVLSGEFIPVCLTESKLYGTWDDGGVGWTTRIDEWIGREPDLGAELHTLAGWPVRRIYTSAPAPRLVEGLVRIPDLEDLPGGEADAPVP